jgi:S-DNA-T family DNA segregation ATPase FtsK/SpoIIIE
MKQEWNYLSHQNNSNETFVVDLAKMPHLLMAGARTRKICGSECRSYFVALQETPLKNVLVDPKSRTDSFNKIERHY